MRGALGALLAMAAALGPAMAQDRDAIRFATFNAALTESEAGALVARLEGGEDETARLVAETIQRVRPDVLLLQEIDRDVEGYALGLFLERYLAVGQNGAEPIRYAHIVYPVSNTGVPLGVDVDGDGVIGGPNDARGFGFHPGQYAFALLSQRQLGVPRTYANLLWRAVPDNLMPPDYYSEAARAVLPLSSKTHLVVPVDAGAEPIFVIAAHPTPPVFDDERDWNGRRNADEIRLVVDIADGAGYVVDDQGVAGGLPAGAAWIAMGDLNADPTAGDSRPGAIDRLLGHPSIDGGPDALSGVPTATFGGGLRVDYVLPSRNAGTVVDAGVAAYADDDPLAYLNAASDHRLVWVDLVPPSADDGGSSDGDGEAVVE